MNTALEKLLKNFLISDKDKYEIRQIFNTVNEEKQKNILKNFDYMIFQIIKIKEEIKETQEILLGKAISNIESAIKLARNNGIKNTTTDSINLLKRTI